MKFPIGFGWWFSAVLNKYPYSSCLNPHIGIYRPKSGGYFLRFPPHWPVWKWDIHPRDRRSAKIFNRREAFSPRTKVLFRIGTPIKAWLTVFRMETGVVSVYWRVPFGKTRVIHWTPAP